MMNPAILIPHIRQIWIRAKSPSNCYLWLIQSSINWKLSCCFIILSAAWHLSTVCYHLPLYSAIIWSTNIPCAYLRVLLAFQNLNKNHVSINFGPSPDLFLALYLQWLKNIIARGKCRCEIANIGMKARDKIVRITCRAWRLILTYQNSHDLDIIVLVESCFTRFKPRKLLNKLKVGST